MPRPVCQLTNWFRIPSSADILLDTTKGIRYNLATANETIASLHAVKHDPDALKQFLAEREELAAVIKENASDLIQWKHQLGRVKSLKDIELTKRRKSR